jgi:hypothetical protein
MITYCRSRCFAKATSENATRAMVVVGRRPAVAHDVDEAAYGRDPGREKNARPQEIAQELLDLLVAPPAHGWPTLLLQ